MNPLRAFTIAGVVGAATLGSGLLADLFGVPDHVADGQTLVAHAPSMLASPNGYAPAPQYNSTPGYYRTPTYNTTAANNYAPAYTPQPTAVPHGFTAYPSSGSGPAYPQAAPYQYQPRSVLSSWPYVQTDDGQKSVLLESSESLGGPPLASPQVQPSTPHHHNPMQQQQQPFGQMQQMPNYQMQPNPGYATPGYATPGNAMPGSPYGAASCDSDSWTSGYASTCGGPPVVRNWFGSVGGLWMTRSHTNHFTFSYGTGNEADQRTDSRDADMGWTGGVDVRFGRYFNCQHNAIEAVYWGLSPVTQTTQTFSGNVLGNLNGILNWSSLDYGGTTADVFVNVAPGNSGIHQVTREYLFQNVELNLWQFCGSCATGGCNCSRLRTNWLAGVRYFQFNEYLLFASDPNSQQITGSNDEIGYCIDLKNQLLGFQVGNQLQYCLTNRLTADLGTKLGIYGNRINHSSDISGNLGTATINNGPLAGELFSVCGSKNEVAFLGELNLGLRYCFSQCWAGALGYRALAVTGVALPTDQIYPDLRGINDVANVDSSRYVILHGAYAGLVYNW